MRKYETVVISDPDLQDQTRKELFEKVSNIIDGDGGNADWGKHGLVKQYNETYSNIMVVCLNRT